MKTHPLPWFKEVQICRDAGKRELADKQRCVQPCVPFFLIDKPSTLSVQLGKGFQLCYHMCERRTEARG